VVVDAIVRRFVSDVSARTLVAYVDQCLETTR